MANLTPAEKALLERLFRMKDGYVLDFTNRAFREFVLDSVGRDIYGGKYDHGSSSKANLLRCFWRVESGPIVGKLIEDIIEYLHVERRVDQPSLANQCLHVALRLQKEGADGVTGTAVVTVADAIDATPHQELVEARPSSSDALGAPSAGAEGARWPARALVELANELAKLVYDQDTAKTLLRRASYPLQFLPDFKVPLVFWDEVVAQIVGGRSILDDLVEIAVVFYPQNPVLLEWRERIGASAAARDPDASHGH